MRRNVQIQKQIEQQSNLCKDKEDVVYYMEENDIGGKNAIFYEEICRVSESRMDYQQADKYLLEGKFKQAEPMSLMSELLKNFEERMETRIKSLKDLLGMQIYHDANRTGSSSSSRRKRIEFEVGTNCQQKDKQIAQKQKKNRNIMKKDMYKDIMKKKKKLPDKVYIGDGINIFVDEEYRQSVFPNSTLLVSEYLSLVDEVQDYLQKQEQKHPKQFESSQKGGSESERDRNKNVLLTALQEDMLFPPHIDYDLEFSWIGREEKKYRSFQITESQQNSQQMNIPFNICDFLLAKPESPLILDSSPKRYHSLDNEDVQSVSSLVTKNGALRNSMCLQESKKKHQNKQLDISTSSCLMQYSGEIKKNDDSFSYSSGNIQKARPITFNQNFLKSSDEFNTKDTKASHDWDSPPEITSFNKKQRSGSKKSFNYDQMFEDPCYSRNSWKNHHQNIIGQSKSIEKLRNVPQNINLQNISFQSILFSQELSQVNNVLTQEGFLSPQKEDDNFFKLRPKLRQKINSMYNDRQQSHEENDELNKNVLENSLDNEVIDENNNSFIGKEDDEIKDLLDEYCLSGDRYKQPNNSMLVDQNEEKENMNLIVNQRRSKSQSSKPRKALQQLPIEEFTYDVLGDEAILPFSLSSNQHDEAFYTSHIYSGLDNNMIPQQLQNQQNPHFINNEEYDNDEQDYFQFQNLQEELDNNSMLEQFDNILTKSICDDPFQTKFI